MQPNVKRRQVLRRGPRIVVEPKGLPHPDASPECLVPKAQAPGLPRTQGLATAFGTNPEGWVPLAPKTLSNQSAKTGFDSLLEPCDRRIDRLRLPELPPFETV